MSIKAILKIDGKKFNLLQASYSYTRYMDESGYATSMVRLNRINMVIPSNGDIFFLNWMFSQAMQKAGSISFYEDEDMIRKVKRIAFAGAFCVGFKEIFHSLSGKPMLTELVISAGGMKMEESTFRFPWFKGPFKSEIEEVVMTEAIEFVGKPASVVKPASTPALKKTEDKPQEATNKNKKEREGHPVKLEDIEATEPMLMGSKTYVYYIVDKSTGADIAEVTMPNDPGIGPSFHIDVHKAYLPSGNPIRLKPDGDFSFTAVVIGLAIDVYKSKFGKAPDMLPGEIIDSNLLNFKKKFIEARQNNKELTDEDLFQIAIRSTSFGYHRTNAGYGDFKLILMKKNKTEIIENVTYVDVPRYVEIEAKKTKK